LRVHGVPWTSPLYGCALTTAPVLIFGGTGGTKLSSCAAALGDAPVPVCDVNRPQEIEAASAGGAIAGLAYCVGSTVLKPLKRVTAEDFETAFRLTG
jgi:hypothetical protein